MKKKVLLIATKFGEKDRPWLTNELVEYMEKNKIKVDVLALSWLKEEAKTGIKNEGGVRILRYKLPNFFYSEKKIVKYIKQLIFSPLAYRHYKKELKKNKFEKVITFSPSHLTTYIVKKVKRKSSYLILWDFFPYYLSDLGTIKKKFLFKVLLKLENKSFLSYDTIGVMTEKNKFFLLEKYKKINSKNVEILPIWTSIKKIKIDNKIRAKYKLKSDDIVLVYGGAHSKVQELDNLLKLAKKLLIKPNVKVLFIGSGTDKNRLKEKVKKDKIRNVLFLDYIPREEYEKLIRICDIGLVSLSRKLNVPSFPSKSLDYLKAELPIIASIDNYTDYGTILEEKMKAGYSSLAGDIEELYNNTMKLLCDEELRKEKGKNGRKYYEEHFSVENIFNTIFNERK